jgi:hypothetical protein
MEIISGILSTVSGQRLGSVDFVICDTSSGEAGTSASVEARFEGSSGQTALVFSTGTGTTLAERMRVKSDGVVDIPVLESNDATFVATETASLIVSASVTLPNTVGINTANITTIELTPTSAPPNPPEGSARLWVSDGTLGNAGDVMIKVRASNVTQYGTVFAVGDAIALPGYIFDDLRTDADLVSRLNGDADLNGTPDADDTEGAYDATYLGDTPSYADPPPQVEDTGYAFSLDGATNYLTQDAAAQPAGDFTFAAWVCFDVLGSNQRVVSVSLDASTGWEAYLGAGNTIQVQILGDAIYSSLTQIAAARWYHVAIVRDGSDFGIYIDGTLSGGWHTVTYTAGGPVRWARARTATAYLDGKIADMMIYSRALTGAEILAIAEGP